MSNKTAMIPVVMIGLFITLTCKQWTKSGSNDVSNARNSNSRSFTADGKEWASFDLKDTDLKVDFPGTPVDKSPPLPPSYKEVFSAARIYAYDEKDFQSSATELIPTGKGKLTIKLLADTSMTAVKKQLPDLTYTLDIQSDTNAKINGSFSKNGKSYDLRGCCIYKKAKPARVWEVLTLYPKENTDAQTAGKRIIDSAVFKDSTEECE
jgi:hypothetical protein